jgi:hypothetical protein
MTVLITLTLAGIDVGPFDIYSNSDGFTTPIVTGVSRAALVAGYYLTPVPDDATQILVRSTGVCDRSLYLDISGAPTTTTTSTSSTSTSTTTTTTTVLRTLTLAYNVFSSSFTIVASMAPLESVTVGSISADGYPTNTCTTSAVAGAALSGGILGLSIGQSANSSTPSFISGTWSTSLTSRLNSPVALTVNGVPAGSFNSGDIVTIGGYGYIVYVVSNCI